MNWKQIYEAATPAEREEIMCLLFRRSTNPKPVKNIHSRARVHWLGRYKRPRRRERILFIVSVFGSIALLDPDQYLMWAIFWGGGLSLFLILQTLYRLLPRRRAHWIR